MTILTTGLALAATTLTSFLLAAWLVRLCLRGVLWAVGVARR
jgi:hypothetical protein